MLGQLGPLRIGHVVVEVLALLLDLDNLVHVLVEQVLAYELGSLEALAAERTQPAVGRQLLRVHLDELVDFVARLLATQPLDALDVEALLVLDVRLHLGLELLEVVGDVLAAQLEAHRGRVRRQRRTHEHDAAPVGHGVLLLILDRVVEVDRVHHAQVEHQLVESARVAAIELDVQQLVVGRSRSRRLGRRRARLRCVVASFSHEELEYEFHSLLKN